MSGIKSYGISGIGKDVELGKKGNRLRSENDKIEARDFAGTSFVPISAGDPIADNDLVTKSYLETTANLLEVPDDGDINDGAITTWEVGATTYSTAIDELNGVLGRLVPIAPPQLSTFTINQTGGSTHLLASGATDNAGTMPAPGTSVYTRHLNSLASTQANGGSGAAGADIEGANGNLFLTGDSGTISAYINSIADGSVALDGTNNSGTYGALQVLSDVDYPAATPGFHTALKARISKSLTGVGYNTAYLDHSQTGTTNTIAWIYDDVANAPSLSGTSYALGTSTTGKFSSGVKHLTDNDTIAVDGTVDDLVGQTYITSNVLRYSTSPSVGTLNMTAADLGTGLTFPLAANLAPQTIVGKTLPIASTARFTTTSLLASAWNSKGSTTNNGVAGDTVLVYTNSLEGSNKPHETRVIGSSANAYRYYLGAGFIGDVPTGELTAPTVTNWDSSQLLNVEGYGHEAVVVAGAIKSDVTNYALNHIPATAGADYSGKDVAQYVTYVFNQATLSSMSISLTGNYSGLWIGLPGVSDDAGISLNALGGNWWNAFALYNGSGVPGRSGDNGAGCANGAVASGNSGQVNITFGTQSSTNATNNSVIIRIKLNAGESISAISIGNTP